MNGSRVLFWDIETTYIESANWGIYQQDAVKVLKDWQILSVAWKWEWSNRVFVKGQDDFPDYVPGELNDKSLLEFMRDLLGNCDLAVAHNGDSFDIKKVNARLAIHKIPPPEPYIAVDTKKMAKQNFAFTSNRLKDLAVYLDVPHKGDAGGIETWVGCINGDPKAWAKMKRYNRQDIPPLEGIYHRMLPYARTYANRAAVGDKPDYCPRCEIGTEFHSRGFAITASGRKYRRFQCLNCGGWVKSRTAENNQKERPLYA